MIDLSNYNLFNSLSDPIPCHQFYLLPEIALRAKALLKTRTLEQLIAISESTKVQVTEYFNLVKEEEIERLKQIVYSNNRAAINGGSRDRSISDRQANIQVDYDAQFFFMLRKMIGTLIVYILYLTVLVY